MTPAQVTPARGPTLAAGALLVAALLAGCTASARPSDSTAPASRPATPPSTGPASTPDSTASTDTPATPPTSAPSDGTTPPGTASRTEQGRPAPPRSTCTSLTIRVLLGSGAAGYEFAALQFVNTGATACTLTGVPTVSLRRSGQSVGNVSRPSKPSARYRSYRLAPGATAESKLKDFSSCNAPLSDTIRVVAPGSGITSTRPGQLRACTLVTYPLGAPE